MAKTVDGTGEASEPPRQPVAKDALTLLESAKSDISAEARDVLIRAAGLVLGTGAEEALTDAASRTSGSDVKADMRLIHRALGQALTVIAWHGRDDGAKHAKQFVRNMVKLAREYDERNEKTSTNEEAVVGALRSLSHASLCDGRSVWFPNYDLIAGAVLRKNRTQPDYSKQVSALARRLLERLAPYCDDNGYRPGVNLRDVAKEALSAGGVDPYNVFNAKGQMRERRLREKLGEQPVGKSRPPRAPKNRPSRAPKRKP